MYNPSISFNELNYQKVVAALKLSLAIFVGIFLVLLSIHNFAGAPLGFWTSAMILCLYALLSDLVFFMAYREWVSNSKKRVQLFNSELFQGLLPHQTDNVFIRHNDKWHFTEETMTIEVAPFQVICNPSRDVKDAIDFNFQALIKLKRNNVDNVISFYNENNINIYNDNGITGVTRTIKINNISPTELNSQILNTAELLKNNGFEPFTKWNETNGRAVYITGE